MTAALAGLLCLTFATDTWAAKRSSRGASKAQLAQKSKVSAKNRNKARAPLVTASPLAAEGAAATDTSANEAKGQSSAADSLILEARRAFVNNDSSTLAQSASAFGRDSIIQGASQHELAEYPQYWRLVLGLRSSSVAASIDNSVERFLESSSNRLLVDQLRGEWIISLTRRDRWTLAREQGSLLLSRDDRQVQCYVWLADLMETGELSTAAREYLLAPRELGEGCNPLLVAASARKQLSRDDLQQRLRLSAEAGAVATGRRTAALMSLETADFSHALRAPGYVLKKGSRETESVVMAVALLARNEPEDAAAHLNTLKLPAETSQFLWAVIAAQGAQRLLPQTIEWTRRAMDARVSDETRGWMARSALAGGVLIKVSSVLGH